MIGDLKYLDVCEFLFEPLQKFCIQRKDHLTAITTNSGILLLKLQPDLDRAVNYVTNHKLFIKPSSYMLSSHIEIDISRVMFDLPQDSVFMCLLQSNVSGTIENIGKKNFFMIKCSISPIRLIGEEPVIVTITDAGSIDVYVKVSHITGLTAYKHILNANSLHIEKVKFRWNDVKGKPSTDTYEEALRRLLMHTAKVVCWTHMLQHNTSVHGKREKTIQSKYCCMIVAYGDGNIVFWQMQQVPMDQYKQATFMFLFEYQSGMEDVTALCWHEANTNSGLLIIGNASGKTVAVPMLNIVMNYCESGKEIVLTNATDVAVDYIEVEVKNSYLIIHVVQQHHVLLFSLDKNAEVCHRMNYDCANLSITGFQKTLADTVVLSTLTGSIMEIRTAITDNALVVDKKDIYLNMDWSKSTLFGFFMSKNNAIFSLLTHHLGYNYKGQLKMKIWNFANNEDQALYKFLKLDRISNGLDLLEVMKVRSLQKRVFIGNELPEDTNYDSLTLQELKKYLCLAKISESIFDQVETVTQYNLKQATDICTMIYTQLSISLLKDIKSEISSKGAVSEYKRQVGHVCFTNLKDIVMSNFLKEHNLMQNYVEEIRNVLGSCSDLMQENTLCKFCEETYVGLSCPSLHLDFRCSFTMVQIVSSKLKCPMCARYIAEEAVAFCKDLSCTLCDSPLDTIISDSIAPFEFEQFCKEDCLSNI